MIRLEIEDELAVVTLDRAPVNALDEAMIAQLAGVLDQLESRSDVGAVLFRSAHARFCAGADIAMIGGFLGSPDGVDRMVSFIEGLQEVYARIENLSQVTVAALDGVATGGGLELALSCDLRVAGAGVRLGLPEVQIGLLPGAGGTQRLTKLAGRAATLRTILTAELVTGEEAERLGIVQWAVPDGQVQEHAREIAQRAARQSRPAIAAVKRCIALAPSPEGFRAEVEESRRLLLDDETRRRVHAFLTRNERGTDKGVSTS